jgi:hypothetical protein
MGCLYIVRINFIQNRARKSSAPNPYLRVSIAAARPKNVPQGLFRMFQLAEQRPRESLFDRYHFQLKGRAAVYAIVANGVAKQLLENAPHSP